jgi:mono/diheme cytochrome c family protein
VRDGVFTREQVERGRTVHNAQCARCHGETLGGGENSPALVDNVFFTFWDGKTVGALVEYTRTTMPSDGPGRISRKRCIDLAAFLLSENGFPSGDRELPTELDALDQITITRTK